MMDIDLDLDYLCGIDNEDILSEQGASVSLAQLRSHEAFQCTQEAYPWDICDSVVEENFPLFMQPGESSEQPPCASNSCGSDFLFDFQQNIEEFLRLDQSPPSSVESGIAHESENSTCTGDETAVSANSVPVQCEATQNKETVVNPKYICSECGKKFSWQYKFNVHQRVHTKEKPYLCEVCGMRFSYHSNLTVHLKVHTGVKPYECSKCKKKFHRKSCFTKHQLIHTDIKPYKCDECRRTFRFKYVLEQHKKLHSGDKPFTCSRCTKGFSCKEMLQEHEKRHISKKFECDVCGKILAKQSYLVVHKRVHSGERPYVCHECGKSYMSQAHLNQHSKVHTRPVSTVKMTSSLPEN